MDIEKKNSELKKKYALPELNKLRKDLGFWKLEEEENILKEIRKKIDEKIELFVKILSRMLQPDTVITDMQESAMFS
ncbi:MAG: hypothetical protein KKE20_00210, partial [Nanoarchaeota archaeon]|nr:hypothetical protein [Nanoarchaeota archaeon]